MKKDNLENILFVAWAASIIAMLGSLFFSEIRQYEPCTLCWYQRILMYPLPIIIGIALIRKDYWISFYTMILSRYRCRDFHLSLFATKNSILYGPCSILWSNPLYRTIY